MGKQQTELNNPVAREGKRKIFLGNNSLFPPAEGILYKQNLHNVSSVPSTNVIYLEINIFCHLEHLYLLENGIHPANFSP